MGRGSVVESSRDAEVGSAMTGGVGAEVGPAMTGGVGAVTASDFEVRVAEPLHPASARIVNVPRKSGVTRHPVRHSPLDFPFLIPRGLLVEAIVTTLASPVALPR